MSIRIPDYIPLLAGASVTPNRLVKIGAADQTVILSTAASDKSIGVSAPLITTATGAVVDVAIGGVAEVIAGGTVTRGDRITSDANGAGVTAAPAAGTNNFVVGIALESAVSGDVFSVLLVPQVLQG